MLNRGSCCKGSCTIFSYATRKDEATKKMCEFFNANSEHDAKIRLLEGQQKGIELRLGNMMKAIQNGLYSMPMNFLIAELE